LTQNELIAMTASERQEYYNQLAHEAGDVLAAQVIEEEMPRLLEEAEQERLANIPDYVLPL
jgi:hypothetical protein